MRKIGFTLIEILIVMAILGVLIGAITSMLSSSLQITNLAQTQADQLLSLKDASGYVGEQVRSSVEVYSDLSVIVSGTTTAICTTATAASTSTGPCFGVKQPSAFNITGAATSFVYRFYRLRFRSGATLLPGNAWANTTSNGVYVLEEYRNSCNAGSCPTASSGAITLTDTSAAGTWYVVTDMLSLTGSGGTGFSPFTIQTNSAGNINTGVEIKLRSTGNIAGRQIYIPSNDYMKTTVYSRNI